MVESKATEIYPVQKRVEVFSENPLSEEVVVAMEELGVRRSHLLKLEKKYSMKEIYEYVDGCLNQKPLDYYFGLQDLLL